MVESCHSINPPVFGTEEHSAARPVVTPLTECCAHGPKVPSTLKGVGMRASVRNKQEE